MKTYNSRQADGPISRKEPFKSYGALSAKATKDLPFYEIGIGKLPPGYSEHLDGAEYVVYSYQTPILWFKDGKWYEPQVRYSPNTTQHQSKARLGAHYSGEEVVVLTGQTGKVST